MVKRNSVFDAYKKDFKKVEVLTCDYEGCDCEATHKAPKNRDLREYYNFCLKHVVLYNKKWDFFKDMSVDEIESYNKNELYGGGSTKKFGVNAGVGTKQRQTPEDLIKIFRSFRDGTFTEQQARVVLKEPRSSEEDIALEFFSLDFPFSEEELKKSYKDLVKKHHPDKHKGDKKREDIFKKVVEYNDTLKKLLKKFVK